VTDPQRNRFACSDSDRSLQTAKSVSDASSCVSCACTPSPDFIGRGGKVFVNRWKAVWPKAAKNEVRGSAAKQSGAKPAQERKE
jgi:hypothetical protein